MIDSTAEERRLAVCALSDIQRATDRSISHRPDSFSMLYDHPPQTARVALELYERANAMTGDEIAYYILCAKKGMAFDAISRGDYDAAYRHLAELGVVVVRMMTYIKTNKETK